MSENIGIFRGKAATYNRVILETLYLKGPQKAWDLAKKVTYSKKLMGKYDPHNVYSVLIRKGGRLDDLEQKKYIFEDLKMWYLNFKGMLAILVLEPELSDKMSLELKKYMKDDFKKFITKIPKNVELSPGLEIRGFNKSVKKNSLKVIKKLYSPKMMKQVGRATKELIEEGIDLDSMNGIMLIPLIWQKMHFKALI